MVDSSDLISQFYFRILNQQLKDAKLDNLGYLSGQIGFVIGYIACIIEQLHNSLNHRLIDILIFNYLKVKSHSFFLVDRAPT